MKVLSVLSFMAGSLAFSSSALAHCGLTDLALAQAISQKNELRRSENAQVARDLRTLHEAAFILDANKHTAECQRLVAVVRELVADPPSGPSRPRAIRMRTRRRSSTRRAARKPLRSRTPPSEGKALRVFGHSHFSLLHTRKDACTSSHGLRSLPVTSLRCLGPRGTCPSSE